MQRWLEEKKAVIGRLHQHHLRLESRLAPAIGAEYGEYDQRRAGGHGRTDDGRGTERVTECYLCQARYVRRLPNGQLLRDGESSAECAARGLLCRKSQLRL